MEADNQEQKLNNIVDALLGREPHSPRSLLQFASPFDVSRPNIHDSKKEFLREFSAVKGIVRRLREVFSEIYPRGEEKTPEHQAMFDRLKVAVEAGAFQRKQSVALDTPSDLAVKNVYDTGFFYGSARIVVEMFVVYDQRLVELRDQEKQFWSVPNRAPNHYARTIALRLARLYSKEKGQRPTFGISREGNFPSTDFGRALEQVFEVLGVKASVRPAAEWAINELTDDDLVPPQNMMGGLFSLDIPRSSRPVANALANLSMPPSEGE